MKKYLLASLLLFAAAPAGFGQWYKTLLPSAEFTKALETIVTDFRLDYRNIQGNIIDSLGETEIYGSVVKLPGSDDCRILRFHSASDTTACWQAIVYSGDNYKEAVRAYENTVRLVRKSNMHWVDRSVMNFTGELVAAREDIRFTTSTLLLTLDDPRYRGFRAEIVLVATNVDKWEVQLNLGKKPEMVED